MQKDRLYIFKNKIDVQSLDLFLRKNEIRVPVIFRKIYNFSEIMVLDIFPKIIDFLATLQNWKWSIFVFTNYSQ